MRGHSEILVCLWHFFKKRAEWLKWLMKSWVENDKYADYAAESWCRAQKQCKRSSSHLLKQYIHAKYNLSSSLSSLPSFSRCHHCPHCHHFHLWSCLGTAKYTVKNFCKHPVLIESNLRLVTSTCLHFSIVFPLDKKGICTGHNLDFWPLSVSERVMWGHLDNPSSLMTSVLSI